MDPYLFPTKRAVLDSAAPDGKMINFFTIATTTFWKKGEPRWAATPVTFYNSQRVIVSCLKTFHRIEQLLKATVTHSKYFLVKINSRVFGGVKKNPMGTHIAERNLLHFLWYLVFKFFPKYVLYQGYKEPLTVLL